MQTFRLPYSAPKLQYWTTKELDAIEASMSGGGGYTPTCYAYVLVNAGAVAGFGHGALAVSKGNAVTVFSFVGDGIEAVILDDQLVSGFLTQGMSATLHSYSDTLSAFESSPRYDDDYYNIALKMQISLTQHNRILAEGARRLYKQNKEYSLLNYNCMDCALDLLSCAGVSISWNQDLQNVVTACASAFSALFGPVAYAALQNELNNCGRSFTIPVSVVDGYRGYSGQLITSPIRMNM